MLAVTTRAALGAFTAAALVACSGGSPSQPADPGMPVDPTRPQDQAADLARIEAELSATSNLSAQQLAARYETAQVPSIDFDPSQANRLQLVNDSALALDATEQALFDTNGFVVSERQRFPSFLYGYETIYMQDLPVYVSADAVLHAVHSSYDEILKTLELAALIPALDQMLVDMRSELASGAVSGLGAQAEADVDLYLSVALSLLRASDEAPVAGANAGDVRDLVDEATKAEGWKSAELFGVTRDMDFSQFTPRGHYAGVPALEQYFRAMMWLGRIDLRIIETQPDHSQVFHRRQLESAYGIRLALTASSLDLWSKIDGTIEAFVGEPDNMTLHDLDAFFAELGIRSPADLGAKSDQELAKAILEGGYGAQRISSHIMINGLGERTMPLSSTFLLLGQRYVVDSHVFSNVVYDRVANGEVRRMMPDPLDVAFAALGNDQAAQLLQPELQQYAYAPDLHAMRFLVDEHGETFWGQNLYNRWLSALRTLSPTAELGAPQDAGLPQIAATEAWGRRMLNTQMASWAELRHDTLLYAKQSYTGGVSCEFPDAYVDPYPAFFEAIEHFAQQGRQVALNLDLGVQQATLQGIVDYFTELEQHAGTLKGMAEQQRTGAAFTEDQMAWINQAVVVHNGCGSPVDAEGWLSRLYYDRAAGASWDPTIADVHTQPTDEAGNPVGKVLHVGTGGPRVMVVAIPTCTGVNTYVGLVSSYFEHTTGDFERLTDEDWSQQIGQQRPADPSWMQSIVAR